MRRLESLGNKGIAGESSFWLWISKQSSGFVFHPQFRLGKAKACMQRTGRYLGFTGKHAQKQALPRLREGRWAEGEGRFPCGWNRGLTRFKPLVPVPPGDGGEGAWAWQCSTLPTSPCKDQLLHAEGLRDQASSRSTPLPESSSWRESHLYSISSG